MSYYKYYWCRTLPGGEDTKLSLQLIYQYPVPSAVDTGTRTYTVVDI